MATIKILPEHLINQIAAGEVVERPASVVKELVENSLDAGAARITIEVQGGGDSLVRITDDGCGMDKQDAQLAFERHATSKISSAVDLVNIRTLGFRGEAIASIASVSYLTLQTKLRGAMEGTLIVSEGGKLKKIKSLGCPEGTQIEVRQLFFNTPARKKYLKNDATEYGHILDTVTGMALANPGVAFRLVRDEKLVLDLPLTEDSLTRIRDLLGRETAENLIPVFYGHSSMQLEGFIGKPLIARANRRGQHLFVNGREVSSHVLSYAVKQAYHSLLPKEKHPVFVLFLTVAPELVDVNVHPRKLEVRFSDEKAVFSAFIQASRKTLEKHVLAPEFEISTPDPSADMSERRHQSLLEDKPGITDFFIQNGFPEPKNEGKSVPATSAGAVPGHTNLQYVSNPVKSLATDASASYTSPVLPATEPHPVTLLRAAQRSSQIEIIPLSQLDNSYILCQQGKTLVIVDQHAAHERIRYTELLEQYEQKQPLIQPLLTPSHFELSPAEIHTLEENKELLHDMGFEIGSFGGNTYSVFGVPGALVKEDPQSMVRGIIDDLQDRAVKGDFQARKEKALIYAACRSAVKFGDPLGKEEMASLCKRLMELDLPYTCPHGRPTMITLTADELKKRFGRDYRG